MNLKRLKADLIDDEGRVPHAYQDSLGFWTIAIGHLIDKRKGGRLSDAAIDFIFNEDVTNKTNELFAQLPWVKRLDDVRLNALINMTFQLGARGVAGFKITLSHILDGSFDLAADEMLRSDWAKQTPVRAEKIAAMIRTGRYADGELV